MISDYLEMLFGESPHNKWKQTQKGTQGSWNCPFCGDTRHRLFINIDRKVVWCHNCQYAGSLITFISDFQHIPWGEALKTFRNYEGYEVQLPDELEEEVYKRFLSVQVEQEKFVFPLPDEYTFIMDGKGKAANAAYSYMKGRGLTLDDMEKYGIGFCSKGYYRDRIIMPDFEDEDLIYWQARTWLPEPTNHLLKKHYRKVLNPSLSEEQVKQGVVAVEKSDIISNIDFVRKHRMAVICEGKFDGYTIGETGAPIHGKHLSDSQLHKLVQHKDEIDDVFIMLDGDAKKYAVIMAQRVDKYFPNHTFVCPMPNEKADPNSIGRKGCISAIESAILYTPLFEIRSRLMGF